MRTECLNWNNVVKQVVFGIHEVQYDYDFYVKFSTDNYHCADCKSKHITGTSMPNEEQQCVSQVTTP